MTKRAADPDREDFARLVDELRERQEALAAFVGHVLTPEDRSDLLEYIRRHASGGTRATAIGWAREFVGRRAA